MIIQVENQRITCREIRRTGSRARYSVSKRYLKPEFKNLLFQALEENLRFRFRRKEGKWRSAYVACIAPGWSPKSGESFEFDLYMAS